jgi:hypothetical protein
MESIPYDKETITIRKKDLIQFYKYKRTFLLVDEWSFYLLLVFLHFYGMTLFIITPILFYGSLAIYTSYKNLDKIEKQIVSCDQEIIAVKDGYMLGLQLLTQSIDYFTPKIKNQE